MKPDGREIGHLHAIFHKAQNVKSNELEQTKYREYCIDIMFSCASRMAP